MASRRPSTREDPQVPLVIPFSDLEEILRIARASLRQTSRAAKEATPGLSRDIPAIISMLKHLVLISSYANHKILGLRNLQALFLVNISSLTNP